MKDPDTIIMERIARAVSETSITVHKQGEKLIRHDRLIIKLHIFMLLSILTSFFALGLASYMVFGG